MHVFWHNDGVSLRPDTQQEHEALVLLWQNCRLGWPATLTPGLNSEALHLGVTDEKFSSAPDHSLGQLGDQQAVVLVDLRGQITVNGIRPTRGQ